MWYVAVVAVGYFPMRTVVPGDVLGSHQVAVDAGFGVIGKVGGSVAELQNIHT